MRSTVFWGKTTTITGKKSSRHRSLTVSVFCLVGEEEQVSVIEQNRRGPCKDLPLFSSFTFTYPSSNLTKKTTAEMSNFPIRHHTDGLFVGNHKKLLPKQSRTCRRHCGPVRINRLFVSNEVKQVVKEILKIEKKNKDGKDGR